MESKCLFCEEELTQQNQSVEHIIPNVFGGRLKSKEIFCKLCNNIMGNSIDVNLAKNFEFFTFLVNPKTERRTHGKIEGSIEDTQVILHNGSRTTTKYQPKITKHDNGKIEIDFKGYVTNDKDQEIMYRQILSTINGVSKDKKYTLDEVKDMCKAKTIKHPLTLINPPLYSKRFYFGIFKNSP